MRVRPGQCACLPRFSLALSLEGMGTFFWPYSPPPPPAFFFLATLGTPTCTHPTLISRPPPPRLLPSPPCHLQLSEARASLQVRDQEAKELRLALAAAAATAAGSPTQTRLMQERDSSMASLKELRQKNQQLEAEVKAVSGPGVGWGVGEALQSCILHPPPPPPPPGLKPSNPNP